jgi:hypothetical protein
MTFLSLIKISFYCISMTYFWQDRENYEDLQDLIQSIKTKRQALCTTAFYLYHENKEQKFQLDADKPTV